MWSLLCIRYRSNSNCFELLWIAVHLLYNKSTTIHNKSNKWEFELILTT